MKEVDTNTHFMSTLAKGSVRRFQRKSLLWTLFGILLVLGDRLVVHGLGDLPGDPQVVDDPHGEADPPRADLLVLLVLAVQGPILRCTKGE